MSRINEMVGSTQLSMLWICALAAAIVFAALMYSTALFHRKEFGLRDPLRDPIGRVRITKAAREVSWTIVSIFIVIAAAAPAMKGAVTVERDRSLVTENRADTCAVPVDVAAARILPAITVRCAQLP